MSHTNGTSRTPGLPRAAVVVPCFNHGAFVAEAVRSALAQHDAEVRVVVVNDGSDDGMTAAQCIACAAIDPERIKVIHQRNHGLPAARNAGAAAVKTTDEHGRAWAGWEDGGDYLVFLDSDDWIERTFVSRLHRAMLEDGGTDASHGYCQELLTDKASGIWRVPDWDPVLLMVTNLHPVTALVRRDRFEEAGGFDETLTRGYEDWDLWLRFASRGWRGVRVREPLFIWRRHSETTMVMQAVQRHAELFALLMERHRGLYDRHARAVIERSNLLLRRADANWLDETGEAIYVRDLRARNCELFDERDAGVKMIEALKRELADERARCGRAEAAAARGDDRTGARLKRRVSRATDALAGGVGHAVRALGRWARRAH